MTNERLEELEDFVELVALRNDRADLLALIDQAKQPKSDAVQRAIDYIENGLIENAEDWSSVADRKIFLESLNLAITALRQMTAEPCEWKIIDWMKAMQAYKDNSCKPIMLTNGLYEIEIRRKYDKQMSTEPCDWCCGEDRFECYLVDDDGNTISIKDNVVQTVIAHFCPNCGRRLGVE